MSKLRIIIAVALGLLALAVLAGIMSGKPDVQPSPNYTPPATSQSTGNVAHKAPVVKLTAAQKAAKGEAENYLRNMHLSRRALIDQVVFEGHKVKDATVAIDSMEINFQEQAVEQALSQAQVESNKYSEEGLMAALLDQKYTTSEAKAGVAAAKAEGYLK